jgi:actin-related protein
MNSPILSSWKGASLFAQGGEYKEHLVTKKEYEEYGSNICFRRFLA